MKQLKFLGDCTLTLLMGASVYFVYGFRRERSSAVGPVW